MAVSSGFAIVTGANSGLGLHLVKSLYASGAYASIVMACRSEQRAKSAMDQIICSGDPSSSSESVSGTRTTLEFIKLDLTSKASVHSFVAQLAAGGQLPRQRQKGDLRLLVNNAGIMGHPFQLVDGVEVHFATNHLGHFLLTKLLIDQHWLADDARILLVTSGLYEKCRSLLTIDDLTTTATANLTTVSEGSTAEQPRSAPHSSADYYAFSKLANCLHTVALAKRIANDGAGDENANLRNVKVVAIRPGFVRGTELGRHTNVVLRMLAAPLIWMIAKNLDQGISSMLHCAQCDAAQLQNGALYYEGRAVPYGAMVTPEAADKLWEMSEQMLHGRDGGGAAAADDGDQKNG